MTKRRRVVCNLLAFLLAAVGCVGLLVWRAVRQYQLDHALSKAALNDDVVRVCRLLREGANPNAPWGGYTFRDEKDRILKGTRWPTILEWKKGFGDPEIARVLALAVTELPDEESLPAMEAKASQERLLFMASLRGDLMAVQSLLLGGASVNAVDRQGRTPLVYAVNGRQRRVAVYLLSQGANPNARMKENGLGVLANALIFGDPGLCLELIAAGARVNAQDAIGDTPLTIASRLGDIQRVREFLRHGADPNLHPKDGPGALDWALTTKKPELVALLTKAGAKPFRAPTFGGG